MSAGRPWPGADFLAFQDDARRQLFAAVERACSHECDWSRRVRAAVEAGLGLIASDPALGRLLLFHPPGVSAQRSALRLEETLRPLVGLLRAGRSGAGLPAAPARIEEALLGGLAFIVDRRLRAGEEARLPAMAPHLAAFLLTPYRGGSGPPPG